MELLDLEDTDYLKPTSLYLMPENMTIPFELYLYMATAQGIANLD